MRSIFEKGQALNTIHAQMLIIIVAFVIMGISSFLFVSRIEENHLIQDAEHALELTESRIISYLLEPETFLSSYSETIRGMLINGDSEMMISSYMREITQFLVMDRERMTGLYTTHGYFFSWGGKHITSRILTPAQETSSLLLASVDIKPEDTPWYQPAIDAKGKIVISKPYKDTLIGNNILTLSRSIFNNNGERLAVICLDIDLSRIYNHAISINLTEGSYGILLNNNLEAIAHPEAYFIGSNIYSVSSGLSALSYELEALRIGELISKQKIKNYMYEDTIVYFKKVKYDWYLGIVIPSHEYYKSVRNMAVFLIVIGSLLATALCTMLYYISQARIKSDLRTQQKSNFLATMSHEIRTPLNAILGMTEIQMQNNSHPPATSEAFMKINNSGNLLLNIINDILDLSKIEAGKLELVPVKYEVSSLINDIIQLNYIRYESKPIEFKIDIDPNIPSVLVGDELRIKQILNNLLSNAFKYTSQGVVELIINAEVVGRGGGMVFVTLVFQVKDTGQGMSTEQISKLFDEYTRFNMEANRTTEGAGLGMTITRNLVNLMYGKINVKSVVGEGTHVTVRLPQKIEGFGIRSFLGKEVADNLRLFKQSNSVQYKKTQISHEYMPYGRILIVDDVETNLYVAKGLMMPYSLKIDLATSGFEAIDKVKSGDVYDIIFMDHMMPKMDGIETTKQLRNMNYKNPIVALTANALAGQAEMFLKNGFDDFISKPIDVRQLNIVLNKLIRDKQPIEVLDAAQKEKTKMEKKSGSDQILQQIDIQLAQIFARDAEKAIKILENCMHNNINDENDIQMYIINVHAMKSALANIGEKELSSTALRLEQAGREKDINVLLSESNDFIDKLKKVVSEIKSKNHDNEVNEDSKEDLVILNEQLKIIKDACTAYDKKAVKKSLNILREKTWSHDTKEFLDLIAEHILHSEFDEASVLVEKNIK